MYRDILHLVYSSDEVGFDEMSARLQQCVDTDTDFLATLAQIGTIPEAIPHDSTEEKIFSKASDAVLSRAFREIGLKSVVLKERGNSADVIAESPIFGYTLVADAKAFRLSRTAKNQKDYKVAALSSWRQDAEYAVLCAPYFHYPSRTSQIYAQALQHNVCLLSWEHLIFFISHGLKETPQHNFSSIWNFCDAFSHAVLCSDMSRCFLDKFDDALLSAAGLERNELFSVFQAQISAIVERSKTEKEFWHNETEKIKCYSREQAISELITEKKIPQKISQINRFLRGLQYGQ